MSLTLSLLIYLHQGREGKICLVMKIMKPPSSPAFEAEVPISNPGRNTKPPEN